MPGAQPLVQSGGDQLQMVDRTRRRAVTVGTRALLVQTTDYTRYESFAEWIGLAVHALEATGEAAAMERIGLRYTDEIRIPGVERPADWAPYVAPTLLGPINLLDRADASTTQGLVEFAPAERQRLVMRYGAGTGWMVAPDGVLRTTDESQGARDQLLGRFRIADRSRVLLRGWQIGSCGLGFGRVALDRRKFCQVRSKSGPLAPVEKWTTLELAERL